MEEKKINSVYTIYNSLVDLLHNILIEEEITKEEIFYSLFGIIVLDLVFNKEDMVKNKEGITYESIMSDSQLEDILLYLDIQNVDKNNNGASIYATIRNKLAHGDYYLEYDYIVFDVNNKECRVLLKDFIRYYIDLTSGLHCRFKDKKFVKNQLIDKSIGKFDKILETREDILEYLKFLSYKKFILRRKDNNELTTREKALFLQTIYNLYDDKTSNVKEADRKLKSFFDSKYYIIDINSIKMKKLDEDKLQEVEKIIKKNNEIYNYDIESINKILYESSEDVYKLVDDEYDSYSIKYGFANTKLILDEMIKQEVYDFTDFANKRTKIDCYFMFGLPINEIIISIILSLIYFNYCYPLEKIYKENKTFNKIDGDFDFSKLNLDELNPNINKLYEIGKNNILNEENIKLNSFMNKYKEFNDKLDNKINQKRNLLKKYNENNDPKLKKIIDKLTIDINEIYNDFKYNVFMYNNQLLKLEDINKDLKENDKNYYNYSIINGIRNSIAHGNIKCKNIASANLKDLELEFIDFYDNDIKFKLNATIDSLFSLLEIENLSFTNEYLKKKLINNNLKKVD